MVTSISLIQDLFELVKTCVESSDKFEPSGIRLFN